MGQDNTMRGRDEDPILRPRPVANPTPPPPPQDLRLENIQKKKNHLKQPNEIKVLAYPPITNSQI